MNGLIRTPESWARQWGWVSRRKAENRARELRELATRMRMRAGLTGDESALAWARELDKIARRLAPPMPQGGFPSKEAKARARETGQ